MLITKSPNSVWKNLQVTTFRLKFYFSPPELLFHHHTLNKTVGQAQSGQF